MGVSFGFFGSPLILDIEEYETLANLSVIEGGKIVRGFTAEEEDEVYFLGRSSNTPTLSTEKKVFNVCKFLNADRVISTRLNSILNLHLKIDVVVIYQEKALCFQAKSSKDGAKKHQKVYEGKNLNPYHRGQLDCRKTLPKVADSYVAPGVAYLDVTKGNESLFSFLMAISKWLEIKPQEEYLDILKTLWRFSKPVEISTLESIVKSREVSLRLAELKGICPISLNKGYVYLNGKRPEKVRVSTL